MVKVDGSLRGEVHEQSWRGWGCDENIDVEARRIPGNKSGRRLVFGACEYGEQRPKWYARFVWSSSKVRNPFPIRSKIFRFSSRTTRLAFYTSTWLFDLSSCLITVRDQFNSNPDPTSIYQPTRPSTHPACRTTNPKCHPPPSTIPPESSTTPSQPSPSPPAQRCTT